MTLRRTMLLVAAAILALAVAAPAAWADALPSAPMTITSQGFESALAYPWTNGPRIIAGQPTPTAYWGPVTGLAHSGTRAFWCAGTLYPSGAANPLAQLYPAGTNGRAQVTLALAEYYSATASFYYHLRALPNTTAVVPDFGENDSFSAGWTDGGMWAQAYGAFFHDLTNFPITGSGWGFKQFVLTDPANTINLSRKDGTFLIDFQDQDEGTSDFFVPVRQGQGFTIDDFLVRAYKYGPVRSLAAGPSSSGIQLTWAKPKTSTVSTADDTRTVTYRVWRSADSAPSVWTELTSSASRVSGLSYTDTHPLAAAAHYKVQAWDTGTGAGYGELAASVGASPLSDSTKPTTSISGVPAGWTKSNVSFTLSAVDEAWNTITMNYRLNGGALTQYIPGHPVPITAEGTTSIMYYSKDQANNTESAKYEYAHIDKSAPVTTADVAYLKGSTVITLRPSDPYSGVKQTYYRIDNGVLQTGSVINLTTSGTHLVSWYSVDNVDNVESGHAASYDVNAYAIDPVQGVDRYGTAAQAVERAYPTGASTIVLAYGQNFPDALGAAALCGAWDAPLLLVQKDYIPTTTSDEIKKLHPTHAIIVGNVASAKVAADVAALVGGASHVQRIGGVDRYNTAALVATATVAKLGAAGSDDIFLAVGDNFPDALAASPAAFAKKWPIVLTPRKGTTLYKYTSDAITALAPKRIHILGSTGAVSLEIENAVKAKYPGVTVDRWAGGNRYGTAVDIANKSGLSYTGVAIATGQNFPDALAGGVMAGKLGNPVLLTPTKYLATETHDALLSHKSDIGMIRYLGSTSAVSDAVRSAISALLQ